MRSVRPFVVLLGLAACLSGCGQKGPLVLPDAQHPHRKVGLGKPPPSPPSAPQGQTGAPPPAGTTPTPADAPASTPQPH